jgi:hypothetical protein
MHHALFRRAAPLTLAFALNAAISASAYAAVISNLSTTPQSLEAGETESTLQPVTIQPSATYRVTGKLVVRYSGKLIHMEENEEYAIWKDGEISLQRHEGRGGRNL